MNDEMQKRVISILSTGIAYVLASQLADRLIKDPEVRGVREDLRLAAGLKVHILPPARVRNFAKAMGQLAKTDMIDAAVIARYLSTQHRDRADRGCAIVALGADVSRQDAKTRRAFETRIESMIELVAAISEGSDTERRRTAITPSSGPGPNHDSASAGRK